MSSWNTEAPVSIPIRLHSRRGWNTDIYGNSYKARFLGEITPGRPSPGRGGVLFSCRTVRVNEKIGLRVTNIPQGETIALGFTSRNPNTVSDELCNSDFTRLNTTPGFWFMCPENASNSDSIVIQYYVNFYGDICLKIDDEDTIENGLCIPGKHLNNLWAALYFLCPTSVVELTRFRSTQPQQIPSLKQKNVKPLTLHPTRGKNVKFSKEKGVAERIDTEIRQGYVFSAKPMLPNQTVFIQILATEPGYAGSLAFGVTSRHPSSIRPCELPDNVERLTERTRGNEEFWKVKANVAENLNREDVLTITRNSHGHIRLGTNDKYPVTCMAVAPDQMLWLFVDIYGATQKIKMYEMKVENANNLRPDTREQHIETNSMLISEQPLQSINQHQLHGRRGDSLFASTSSLHQQQGNPAIPSQPTIAGETTETLTLCFSNQDSALRFNAVHDSNMELSHNRSRARPTCGVSGSAYSNRPVLVDEKVCFRILEEPIQFGIKIAFTCFGPTSANNSAGMSHSLILNRTICKKGSIVRYWVNNSGQGVCNIGDDNLGLVRVTNATEDHLWAVLQIGMGAVVELCNPNVSPQVTSQKVILPPLSLKDTNGENIWHTNATGRDHYIFYKGFVFTANPMRLKQTLVVNNLVSEFSSVGLSFGFTTYEPTNIRICDLPATPTTIKDRQDTWVVDFDCASDLRLEGGEKLAFKLALDGRIYVKKNGRVLHILRMHLDHKQALWGFVHIREKDPPIISPVLPSINDDQEDIEPLEEDFEEEDNVTHRIEEEDNVTHRMEEEDNVTHSIEEVSEEETAVASDRRQTVTQISTEPELILTPEEEAWIKEDLNQPVVTEEWEEIPPELLQESEPILNNISQQSAPTPPVYREPRRHRIPIISPEGIDLQSIIAGAPDTYYYLTGFTQPAPGTRRPADATIGREIPRPAVIQPGPVTTRPAVTELGPRTTGSANRQIGPGTTRPADTQVGPVNPRPTITYVGPATTRPAITDNRPRAPEVYREPLCHRIPIISPEGDIPPITTGAPYPYYYLPGRTETAPGNRRPADATIGPGIRPTVIQPGSVTTRPTVTQVGPSTTRPAVIQVGPVTTKSTVTQVGTVTTRPAVTQVGPSTTRPAVTQVGPSSTRPAVTQIGPSTTRPTVTQVGNASTRPAVTQVVNATTTPAVTQVGPSTTRLVVTQVGPSITRPAVTQVVPSTTRPAVTQVVPSTTRPAVTQVVPSTTRPAVTQVGPSTTRPTVTQEGPSTTRPTVTQEGPSTTRPAVTQVGPSTTRPTVTQVVPSTTRPAVTQVGNASTRPAVTQVVNATTTPAVTQVGPSTTRPAVTQAGPSTTRPAVTQVGPSTTRPTVTQEGPSTTRPAVTQVGNASTRPAVTQVVNATTTPAVTQVGPSTTRPAVTQAGPSTTRPAVTQVGPSTTRPATTDDEPRAPEVKPATAEICNQSIPVYDCIICFDAPINSALSDCGHMYLCYDCAVEQWKGRGDGLCPICRKKIEKVIRIYKP